MLKELWEVVCQSAKINLLFTMEYVIKVISSISLLVSKALLLVLDVSFNGNSTLSLHAHRAYCQPSKKPGTSFIVGWDGAVPCIVVKPMKVFTTFWAEVEWT